MGVYDINGYQYNLSSLDLQIAGITLIGGTELKISEKRPPGEVEGQSSVPVGWTRGPWSGEGSLKLPLAEALTMRAALGNSWMDIVWTATASYTELNGPGIMTIEIIAARFNTTEIDGGDRSKATTDALSFTLLEPPIANGVQSNLPVSSGGLGGLSIGVSISF